MTTRKTAFPICGPVTFNVTTMPKFMGGKAGFNAADFGALSLLLESDAIAGLSDSDPLATWLDQSAAGNDASAAGAARPTYKTGGQNGLPYVQFDGSSDALSLLSTITLSGPFTAAWVVRTPATTDIDSIFGETLSTGSNFIQLRTETLLRFKADNTGTNIDLTHAARSTTVHYEVIRRNADDSVQHWFDGTESTGGGSVSNDVLFNRLGVIGTSFFSQTDLYTAILWPSAVADVAGLNTALAARYGL